MKYKSYVFYLLYGVICLNLLIVGFNYFVDPYGIFRKNFIQQRIQPNQHFIKMNFIINNPQKFDSFIFGSSRVRSIDPQRISNGHYYNMGYPTGLPGEFLADIKIMLKQGVHISNILIGLDEFSFREDPESHYDMLRYPYIDPPWLFYVRYLLQLPNLNDFLSYLSGSSDSSTAYDFYNTGTILNTKAELDIESDVNKHVNDEKFQHPAYYVGNRIDKTLQELNDIKELAKRNNINLIIFINPIHKTTYLNTNIHEFNQFKNKLVHILPYYDFSGLNFVTSNDYYYYETSHYRPMIADLILDQIFNSDRITTPGEFGTFVTERNIDLHLEMLNSQIK